ncbi:hypothetical protein ANO11243_091790 [Dothideomycetidae sp. 11243]|nr:hypothetical protein ANO11243_091790 [fungal sp. No.11243]
MQIKAILALCFGAVAVSALPAMGEAGIQARDVQGLNTRSPGKEKEIKIHEDHTATGPNPPGSGGFTGIKLKPQSEAGAHIHDQIGNVAAGENYQFPGTGGGRENSPPPSPPHNNH